MTRANYLFTSESVSEGHPDKVCDRISDEVVDLFFREAETQGFDPWQVRVACETLATTNRIVIAGEVPRARHGDRRPHRSSYPHGDQGHRLRAGRLPLEGRRHRGAAARPVGRHRARRRRRRREGRGRRRPGHHVRPRCDETPELMPAPILYAHKILETLAKARKSEQRRRQARPRRQEPGHGALRQRQAGRRHADRALDPAPRRILDLRRRARPGRALYPRVAARRLDLQGDRLARQPDRQVRHRRPRRRIAGSPAARSSSTPMAARPRMAAARSRARTRPRSTARPPTRRAISPRTSSRRACRPAARSSSPMPSASQAAVDLRQHLRHRPGRRGQAREDADGSDGPLAARHPHASPSTGRSTPAPPPTAISGVRRRTTAASPGSAPTSSRSSSRRWPDLSEGEVETAAAVRTRAEASPSRSRFPALPGERRASSAAPSTAAAEGKKLRKGQEEMVAAPAAAAGAENGPLDLNTLFEPAPPSPSPFRGRGGGGPAKAKPSGEGP